MNILVILGMVKWMKIPTFNLLYFITLLCGCFDFFLVFFFLLVSAFRCSYSIVPFVGYVCLSIIVTNVGYLGFLGAEEVVLVLFEVVQLYFRKGKSSFCLYYSIFFFSVPFFCQLMNFHIYGSENSDIPTIKNSVA